MSDVWILRTGIIVAGVLLLAVQFFKKDRSQLLGVWKQKQTAVSLLIFGLFGMLAVQYIQQLRVLDVIADQRHFV